MRKVYEPVFRERGKIREIRDCQTTASPSTFLPPEHGENRKTETGRGATSGPSARAGRYGTIVRNSSVVAARGFFKISFFFFFSYLEFTKRC